MECPYENVCTEDLPFAVVTKKKILLASLCVLRWVIRQSVDFKNSGWETSGCEKRRPPLRNQPTQICSADGGHHLPN